MSQCLSVKSDVPFNELLSVVWSKLGTISQDKKWGFILMEKWVVHGKSNLGEPEYRFESYNPHQSKKEV